MKRALIVDHNFGAARAFHFKKGGEGLGLSIARRDLTLIDSELGGAAFRLTLPTCQS